MPGRTALLLAAAMLGAFAWQSAFVQTSGTSAKVSSPVQLRATGRAADTVDAQDEGVAPLASLSFGIMAGLLVALAGASPALAQRNQFAGSGNNDEELKKLDVGAKSSGLLKELGSTAGDPKWDAKEKLVYLADNIENKEDKQKSAQCFSDGIPPANRKTIFFDGQEMPIGLWTNDWASSLLFSSLWEILTEELEKLGYNITKDGAATSRPITFKLAGCFESWQGYEAYLADAFKEFGYVGNEGMFILAGSMQAESVMVGFAEIAEQYLAATGDNDGVTTVGEVVGASSLPKQSRQLHTVHHCAGLIYWWFPDTMFALDSPSIVIFPDYSPSEQKQQIYRTMYVQLGNDPWAAACEWLKENGNLWESWMPNETACTSGKGLVDSSFGFSFSLVGCETCPVGHYSKEQGFQVKMFVCSATREDMLERSECMVCGTGTGQEDKWTTSQAVVAQGKLLLQPGFFSRATEPGMVYRCYGETVRCPGGEPGVCADGRDTTTIACSACLPGLHARDGVCVACGGGDYALVTVVGILGCIGIAVLYVVLMNEGQKSKQPGSLLIAALGMGQMVTIVQQLTVIQQFKIDWGEPFNSILVAMELMAFDLDMISIGCVAPMDPVMKFSTRTLMVLLLFAVASCVHFLFLAWKRSKGEGGKGLQISLLASLARQLADGLGIERAPWHVVFITGQVREAVQMADLDERVVDQKVLCKLVDELERFKAPVLDEIKKSRNPLRAKEALLPHFNDSAEEGMGPSIPLAVSTAVAWFERTAGVEEDEQLMNQVFPQMVMKELTRKLEVNAPPIKRVIIIELPKRIFSVLFLIRNALVVLCPLLPGSSAKVVSMNLILYGSLAMTAYSKPWRANVCNFLDMMLVTGMLVILDMGSLFIQDNDGGTTMVICLIFSAMMLLSIIGAVFYGVAKHFMQKYRKPFRYFLCHQKIAAGSMARLLKMELQKRNSKFTTFVDCDDLNDLTRLFSYVGQDTETFVIMGSPDILTRKWCVGEMCTARSHKVKTVLLAWPDFVKPDKNFIENYDSIVPDITELANYNIGLQEVQDTMAWINTVDTINVPSLVCGESIEHICGNLTGTQRTRSIADTRESPDCIIVSDLDNMEAAATAYVLLGLIVPKLVGGQKNNMPAVLQKDRSVPNSACSALVICSEGCFKQFQFGDWLMQVAKLPDCCVLPIIAEDGFRFPSPSYYEEISSMPQLEMLDLKIYIKAIKAVFQEIAVVFSPQNYSSTQEDLDLRAKQVAWRINSGSLKSLYQKIVAKDDEPEDDKKAIEDGRSNLVMPTPEQILEEIF
ncbi:40S ribosomal protein S6 [Durusdinium trenchii]|uniref:40S ribosomal protein S6 n=3 Tax=Durusdinium trenchii TaxID=1381693 RepID=A0ABP0RQV0_9DINO